jgi:hypothetical protein
MCLARHRRRLFCGRHGWQRDPRSRNKHLASQEAGKLERNDEVGCLPMSQLHNPAALSNPTPVICGRYRRPEKSPALARLCKEPRIRRLRRPGIVLCPFKRRDMRINFNLLICDDS